MSTATLIRRTPSIPSTPLASNRARLARLSRSPPLHPDSANMVGVTAFPTAAQLQLLESQVSYALETRDMSALKVIGFGEVSIALGWPVDSPQFVCKRTPPATQTQINNYAALIDTYIAGLAAIDIKCVDTTTLAVDSNDVLLGYIVQPFQPAELLADNVMRATEPSPDHPLLQELCGVLNKITPRLSVDCQFSNWTWDGTKLQLLDIGSPFLWDEEGNLDLEIAPFMAMFPWPIRSVVHKEMQTIAARWKEPRAVAVDVAASLYRIELENWMDAVLEAFNSKVVPDNPITATEARAIYDEDLKTWPRLKQMQRVQRAWQTKVRRKPYEFFIQNSYTGEII